MTDVVIRLDRSKPFSECRGDRTPDDPHYRVHFWQGSKLGNKYVLLPYDAAGELVPDDGRKDQYEGLVDGKPVMFHPLYTPDMRELVAAKKKRLSASAKGAQAAAEDDGDDEATTKAIDAATAAEEMNFVSYLKGEVHYSERQLLDTARARFFRTFKTIHDLVVFLVDEQEIVTEDEVSKKLRPYLARTAA